jgi:hypothetical protein
MNISLALVRWRYVVSFWEGGLGCYGCTILVLVFRVRLITVFIPELLYLVGEGLFPKFDDEKMHAPLQGIERRLFSP